MSDPTAKPNTSRQAIVPRIRRGSAYCKPRPVSDADPELMHRIDKLHMEAPFTGIHSTSMVRVLDCSPKSPAVQSRSKGRQPAL